MGIAAILKAIAWPCVAVAFYLIYRTKLVSLFDILALKLKHVKLAQIEIDTEQEIDRVVRETGERASDQKLQKEIPQEQIRAALEVGERLNDAPIAFSHKLDVAHKQVYDLISKYEAIRRNMPRGTPRTRKMNEIAAKMRALSIAAYPLLPTLTMGKKSGERLAAICFLQVRPELGYFDWLVERVMEEDQAFLLFHASLAILELVKTHPYLHPESAGKAIGDALEKVSNFPGGHPDQNTIEILQDALSRLKSL
jgi:hypothetical protein